MHSFTGKQQQIARCSSSTQRRTNREQWHPHPKSQTPRQKARNAEKGRLHKCRHENNCGEVTAKLGCNFQSQRPAE